MSRTRFVAGMLSIGTLMLAAGAVRGQATATGSGQDFPVQLDA